MAGKLPRAAWLSALLVFGLGCANARMVEMSGNGGGVVAIPENTNSWPSRNRHHAEELMKQRCPTGYEIDYEREVVVGQVAHTNIETDQHSKLLGLGPARTDTRQTTSYVDQKEWRIWFHPKGAPPALDSPPGQIQPAAGFQPAP